MAMEGGEVLESSLHCSRELLAPQWIFINPLT